jgi:3-oxoacyl-[acyl-carrier-protein] synthase-3
MSGPHQVGVRIAGVGSAVPSRVLSNFDLERMMDTSDAWIRQRTGVVERRIVDPKREGTFTLSREALRRALEDAGMKPADLDLIVVGTVTAEMTCPSVAARVSESLGAAPAQAFDLVAACCGYVYSINLADTLLRSGRYGAVGIVGCDTMSTVLDYGERSVSILFGDAAGAAVLVTDSDPSRGCIYQSNQADGAMWRSLYMPNRPQEIPEHDRGNRIRLGCLRMNGREIFKFAVTKFQEVIGGALEATGLTVDDISQFVCHQSNVRIIASAKEKLGLPAEKVHINIDRYGNCSAGSVGLVLDELWREGRIRPGEHVLLCAFGGGLTWSTSIWRI